MMQNNFIAPNINFEEPDDDTATINVVAQTKNKTSMLFIELIRIWRYNSALIVRRFK